MSAVNSFVADGNINSDLRNKATGRRRLWERTGIKASTRIR
jgi:hypothetical protein